MFNFVKKIFKRKRKKSDLQLTLEEAGLEDMTPEEFDSWYAETRARIRQAHFEYAKAVARAMETLGSVATVIDAGSSDEEIEAAVDEHKRKVAEWELENLKEEGVKKEDLN